MSADRTEAHTKLVNEILLAFGARPGVLLWSNRTGVGIAPATLAAFDKQGRTLRQVITSAPRIVYGLVGSADILGVRMLPVREVGNDARIPVGQFIAIECKTGKAKLTDEQKAFRRTVMSLGGVYIEARSVDDVAAVLGG
jgi:hypothetical protein